MPCSPCKAGAAHGNVLFYVNYPQLKESFVNKKIIEVTGIIDNIAFRDTEGWAAFTIKIDLILGNVSCTGILPCIVDIGHNVTCTGNFVTGKYGKQLKCSKVIPIIDCETDKGVERLLSLLPGIGLIKSRAAVKEFGAKLAWRSATEHPSVLGITNYDKALAAKETAKGLIHNYQAITFLLGIGLTENQSNKIIKRYGVQEAIKQVSTEPYLLINDISGFGFRIVDGIALKAGIKSDSEQRILACILFCLNDNEKNQGNIWFHGKKLINIVTTELTESAMAQNVVVTAPEHGIIKKNIYKLNANKQVVIDKNKIFSKKLLEAEKTIEKCLVGRGICEI